IASSNGQLAYISNYGGGAYNTITVVDLARQQAMPVIDLGALRGPHGLVFVAGKLWFTAEGAKAVGSYDPATEKIDLVLGTGQNRTHMLVVSADGSRIITTNVSSGTVTLAERASGQGGRPGPGGPRVDWDETVIPVGRGAAGILVQPDGANVYVACTPDDYVAVIDVKSLAVTARIAAGKQPDGLAWAVRP